MPSPSSLILESPGREGLPWWFAGRRARIAGGDQRGLTEISFDLSVAAQAIALRVAGQVPETIAIRFAPDEIVRVLRAGSVELTERITVALDHSLVCWGIVADAPVSITLHWHSPLAPFVAPRADPAVVQETEPAPPGPEPLPAIHLAGPDLHLAATAYSGTVRRMPRQGDHTECMAQGDRVLRLVFAGGNSEADLERAREAFARRRLRAFRQDRILHARRIEQQLTALESGNPTLDRAFHWAKLRLDAATVEQTGVGRWPHLPGTVRDTAHACAIARAALAGGDRESAIDLLRLLAQSPDHGVPGAEANDPASGATLDLALAFAGWSGDRATLDRIAPLLPMEVGTLMESATATAHEIPTGWDVAATLGAVLGLRPEQQAGSSRLLRSVVEELWGIVADAPHAEIRVSPQLPAAWPEMALRRLRVGATQLDLRLRRRPGQLVLRVEHLQGPRIRLVAELPAAVLLEQVLLDDEPLGGRRAVFDVAGSHEVVFQLAEGRGVRKP